MNDTHATPCGADLAQFVAAALASLTGHKLLSTATEAELRETSSRFLDCWNGSAAQALQAF